MSNIVKIKTVDEKYTEQCIEALEEALTAAKTGKMRGIVIGYLDTDMGFWTRFTTGRDFIQLLGITTALQHDVLHSGEVIGVDDK